jgi:PAS domain S-box-containing protein
MAETSLVRYKERDRESLIEELETLHHIFDNMHNGVLLTDADGRILFLNRPYCQFMGIEFNMAKGRHCTDVIENTRMHIVGRTGKAEINQTHKLLGHDMVVQRIPIRKGGEVVAVYGQVMFRDVKDMQKIATKLTMLESKVKLYEQELINLRSTRYTIDSIIGDSAAIKALKNDALKATSNKFPVLITGESGTGKELFAQAIHQASPRNPHPFVRLNCAAIPKDLIESELFGYDKGAFTGAKSAGKPGKFELAHRGSIFLDEIGEMPLEMQPKLLRVLEEKEFERVGGTTLLHSDFRLIAATNRNLEEMMAQSQFRRDLYYRLNVIPLHIPPLRQRREDIVPLSHHLLGQMAEDLSLERIMLDEEVEQALTHYDWPGNTRELVNVLERASSLMEDEVIRLKDLPFYIQKGSSHRPRRKLTSLKEAQERAEAEAIEAALAQTDGNKAAAARILGIHRTLMYKKMKRYGIGNTLGPALSNF